MNESLEQVAATCVEKISGFSFRLDGFEDQRVDNFHEKVIMWLEQIEEQDRKHFIELLNNFTYFDRIKVKDSLIDLFNKFVSVGVNQYKSIYMPITSKNGIKNGADELINIFQRANNVSKDVTPSQVSQFYHTHKFKDTDNIILVDDIIASGTTVEYYFKYMMKKYPKLLKDKNIYILCIVITDKALSRVTNFCYINNIKAQFIYEFKHQKAFDPGVVYEDPKLAQQAKKTVKKYEKRLMKKPDDKIYVLGYKQSQLLTSFYYNTPNNTLSTFWLDNDEQSWTALLKRYENDSRYQLEEKVNMFEFIKQKCKRTKKSILNLKKKTYGEE
jgi:hypothetical protein